MATAIITDGPNNKVKNIYPIDYSVITIKDFTRQVEVKPILPFRVQFRSIQIEPIGLGNTPGIGLQVIGYSNYIL